MGGLNDRRQTAVLGSVVTAIGCDVEFADAFRSELVGPRSAAGRAAFERARERGELRDDVDLDLVAHALPGIVLHRQFVLGEQPDQSLIVRVVDQIILPAVLATQHPKEDS